MCMLLTSTVKLSDSSSSLGRLLLNIYLVFLTFRVSLFTLSHVGILLRSEFILTCKVSAFSAEHVKVVSSAYILGLEYSWHKGRSFIYKTNKRGQELILEEFHLLTYRNQKVHR